MSHRDDYRDEMSQSGITDAEIESLFAGDAGGATDPELNAFVATLARPVEPPRDVEQMATVLAATARSAAPTGRAHGLRRLAVLAGAGALVIALSGVAMAADGAVPGDALYGLDRALESIGIGTGGVDERIQEFDELVEQGQDDAGFAMLAEVIETAGELESEKAQQHIELAATKSNPNARAAQEKVARLKDFIEANKGAEGMNGKEFGQGVSNIARSNGDDLVEEDATTSDSEIDSEPQQQPGKSDEAPGQQKREEDIQPESETAEPEEQEGEQSGNSASAPGQQKDKGNSASAPGQQKDRGN